MDLPKIFTKKKKKTKKIPWSHCCERLRPTVDLVSRDETICNRRNQRFLNVPLVKNTRALVSFVPVSLDANATVIDRLILVFNTRRFKYWLSIRMVNYSLVGNSPRGVRNLAYLVYTGCTETKVCTFVKLGNIFR